MSGPCDASVESEHSVTGHQHRVDLDLGYVGPLRPELGKARCGLRRRGYVDRLIAAGLGAPGPEAWSSARPSMDAITFGIA